MQTPYKGNKNQLHFYQYIGMTVIIDTLIKLVHKLLRRPCLLFKSKCSEKRSLTPTAVTSIASTTVSAIVYTVAVAATGMTRVSNVVIGVSYNEVH